MKTLLSLLALCITASFTAATAQVPQVINFQGRVAVNAVNFDGAGQFRFALVDAAGTTTFWSNDGTSANGSAPTAAVTATVTKGLYSVQLGATPMTPISPAIFQNSDVRLRVWFDDGVNGSQLLAPDQRLAAVGYAMVAGEVADGSVTTAKLAPNAVGSAQLAANAVQGANVASGQLVKSLNGLTDNVSLAAGANISLTPSGNTITIGALDPLPTWPGSTALTTLGTITTGTWNATPLADSAIASAALWNSKQPGDGTLTLLSGKTTSGSGGLVLTTAPTLSSATLTTPLLTNPRVSGTTDSFLIGNGSWWSTAVPFLQPTLAGGIAFDIMPRGAAGGNCWIDICSTDVTLNSNSFETLNLTKLANGPCLVGWNGTDANLARDLYVQWSGGRVGVGKAFGPTTPLGLLHVAPDQGSADIIVGAYGAGSIPGLRGYFARGTNTSPLPAQSGDTLLFIGTHGRGSTQFLPSADSGIFFRATEPFTDDHHGTQISLQTTTVGGSTRTERLRIDTDVTVATGNLVVATPGKGLRYTAGANARAGNATLTGGTVTVANTSVTANTLVFYSRRDRGTGPLGELSATVTAGVGFTITSESATENSVVSYQLVETN